MKNGIKIWPGHFIFALSVALLIAAAMLSQHNSCIAVADDDQVPTDYCYKVSVAVTNNTGGTITNWPVRLIFDGDIAISNGWMNDKAWDVVAVTSGNSEVPLMTQDVSSASAAWWLVVPSLADGVTQTFTIYLGNAEAKRDNGLYFNGSDSMSAVDHADFDITDNLILRAELNMLDVSGQDAEIAGHWSSSEGYRLRFVDTAGVLELQAQVNGDQLNVAWPGAANDQHDVRMRFVAAAGNDLFIDRLIGETWTTIASADTDIGSITAPSSGPAFSFGTGLDNAELMNVRLDDVSGIVARWEFHGNNGTETSAVTPNYAGTFPDLGSGSHTATYAFNRAVSQTPAVVGSVELNSAPSIVTITQTGAVLVGDVLGGLDLSATRTANQNIPFFNLINSGATNSNAPTQLIWLGVLMFTAIILLIVGVLITKQFWVGGVLAALPISVGTSAGVLDPWVIIVWITMIVLVFGTARWADTK